MGFIRKRVLRRFSILGRIADLALVGGAAARFAQRKGWISEAQLSKAGLDRWSAAQPLSAGEGLLAAGAAWRLLRRKKPRSGARRR